MNDLETSQLVALAHEYGITLEDHQAELILTHLDLVIEKNKVLNLTRITDRSSAILLHCLDSLLIYPSFVAVGFGQKDNFLDIGTGAGFPGIPLVIVSGMQGTLLDSVSKKVRAVDEFVAALGLADKIQTSDQRAEELARTQRNSFSFVTARAVAELHVLIEYATPLLKHQGSLIVSKAKPSDEEFSHAERAAELCGLKLVSRETFDLPDDAGHREIFTYQKVRKAQVKLPRRPGMAKHNPIYEIAGQATSARR